MIVLSLVGILHKVGIVLDRGNMILMPLSLQHSFKMIHQIFTESKFLKKQFIVKASADQILEDGS